MTATPAAYCPDCGTATEAREIEGRERRVCPSCETVVWQNPVPAAGVAVVREDGVLCTRRDVDPYRDCWALPGGHMEADETPAAAAARELREEVGLRVAPGDLRLLGTRTSAHGGEKRMVVLDYWVPASAVTGEPVAGDEVWAVEWIAPADRPDPAAFVDGHAAVFDAAVAAYGEE